MRAYLTILIFIMNAALSGCQTSSSPSVGGVIEELLKDRDVIHLPMAPHERGLLIVNVGYGDGQSGDFVLDTGATRSAIFKRTQKRLGIPTEDERPIRIYGMFQTNLQSTTTVPLFKLGSETFENHFVAVLDDPEGKREDGRNIDGIIGMDILANYHLYIDGERQQLSLLPLSLGPVIIPNDWRVIGLTANPFLEEDRLLHFMQIRVANIATQALFDTGSEFSLLNWNTARISELRRLRKKLRADWELAGAVGTFDPVSKINVKRFRAGQFTWNEHNFIVLDFKTLNVLGIGDQPFIIAGADIFKGKTYLIDFEKNEIRIQPDRSKVKEGGIVVDLKP